MKWSFQAVTPGNYLLLGGQGEPRRLFQCLICQRGIAVGQGSTRAKSNQCWGAVLVLASERNLSLKEMLQNI